METLASEFNAGSNSAREVGRHLAYHHPLHATFFMEFLISIQTNYSLAMNRLYGYRRERSIFEVYLKSRVYRFHPSKLSGLKYAIRRELSCIKPDILLSAVAVFATRLQCVIPYGGGHVEHILL
ncbi:hypothetical protein NPIL_462061 [Nephila pilipes]|uniref:Uncharacterized protein n=1 Tax=Nephila pilipes TaxID=299642 RepID=A0A8X6NMG4_NEPPI|nr:hypothetical protein NPIL_476741 [Nephila pilipes]GFU24048.1 hypothetical protein NPIL_462061 [Nephila pilipes]